MNVIYVMKFSCFTHLQVLNLEAKSENQYIDDNTIQTISNRVINEVNKFD